jgi:prephenate dehydrogenase
MSDILFSNRKHITQSLSRFINTLEGYQDVLEKNDKESMLSEISGARKIRSRLKFS